MHEDDRLTGADPLFEAARVKRAEADRARRMAASVSSADVVASLNDYARQLGNDAFTLEQQAAELRRTVEHSNRLAAEVKDLAAQAHGRLAEIKSTLQAKKPSRT